MEKLQEPNGEIFRNCGFLPLVVAKRILILGMRNPLLAMAFHGLSNVRTTFLGGISRQRGPGPEPELTHKGSALGDREEE